MSLPYHPWVRPSIGGWVVVATTTAGLELVWGPYPVRADADAVCQSLTVRLIDERAAAMRRATQRRPAPTPAVQPGLFEAPAVKGGKH